MNCGRSVVFFGYPGFLHQQNWPPWYSWNIVESGIKHHNLLSLSWISVIYMRKIKVYDFVKFFKSDFFSQSWTDVSKNSSKTAKNTEKWFSRNISGEMCWQAICVWATLIQVNQDNSASVWWTAHVRNRFETAYVVYKLKLLQKWLIIWVLIDKLCSYR